MYIKYSEFEKIKTKKKAKILVYLFFGQIEINCRIQQNLTEGAQIGKKKNCS